MIRAEMQSTCSKSCLNNSTYIETLSKLMVLISNWFLAIHHFARSCMIHCYPKITLKIIHSLLASLTLDVHLSLRRTNTDKRALYIQHINFKPFKALVMFIVQFYRLFFTVWGKVVTFENVPHLSQMRTCYWMSL